MLSIQIFPRLRQKRCMIVHILMGSLYKWAAFANSLVGKL